MDFSRMTRAELSALLAELREQYAAYQNKKLALDLSRGKPGAKQLDLLQGMLDCIDSSYDCRTESGFDSGAVSSAGAVGLMQLMPATFEWLTDGMLFEHLEPGMLYDPETNVRYGCFYLRRPLFQAAGNFHCTVIPQKAANLSGNLRHRIGGKLGAVIQIKALHGF